MDVGKAIELFIQRMGSKNWSKSTVKNYTSVTASFLNYFKDRPKAKEISANEIEQYLLTKIQINTRKHTRCGIQAFYTLVIGQHMKLSNIPWPKKELKLPHPIEASDIQKILNCCTNIKHKAIISLLYGCGLRISEVINLKIKDIDSKANVIYIIAGKGKKDRIVMLDKSLLELLRKYYTEYKPKEYLFNGQFDLQYSTRSINEFLKQIAEKAGVTENIHAHLLRHSFATHSLEQGTDISYIQKLLGHNSIKTTLIYTHVSKQTIANIPSPLSKINLCLT